MSKLVLYFAELFAFIGMMFGALALLYHVGSMDMSAPHNTTQMQMNSVHLGIQK